MALRHQDQGRANLHRFKETLTLRVMPESYVPPYTVSRLPPSLELEPALWALQQWGRKSSWFKQFP